MLARKAAMSIFLLCSLVFSFIAGALPAMAADNRPLAGRTIILDAGQGEGSDIVFQGYSEHVAMLYLSHAIRDRLEPLGATVRLTRPSEPNVTLPVRAAWINIWSLEAVRNELTVPAQITEINNLISVMRGIVNDATGAEGRRLMNIPFNAARVIHPDLRRVFDYQTHPVVRNNFLSISLHSNATGNPINTNVRGAEVYFINPAARVHTRTYFPNFTYTTESRQFGDILLNHIHNAGIPRRQHGLRAENFFMIREMNIPAVLAENGFHTNPQDRAFLSSNESLGRLADAYVAAIQEYFRTLRPLGQGPWQLPAPGGRLLAGSWRHSNNGWRYEFDGGGFARGWHHINGESYFFNNAGYMQTGWVRDDQEGEWYFLRANGTMATGWVRTGGNWFFLIPSGEMATGWLLDRGLWYYLHGSGAMASGWLRLGEDWYFFGSSGAMMTGWVRSGGHWYFMDSDGVMETGWIQSGGNWYYLRASGEMVSGGTVTIEGERHRFAADGRWLGRA
ncbi:MAG: N-acetylmuramoyl-L-alanine amidase [Oscillospiraceae bacterium]|nr:N-acetylmuramoyl-L-alanine amidase [Oscillospiraceae bacterium]MCL2278215.1 N-acetylmuramoyl-L-alanine amidase [Oscillospiraceae bacterium]